jgi:membrane protein DedA with SNARE-associated domain
VRKEFRLTSGRFIALVLIILAAASAFFLDFLEDYGTSHTLSVSSVYQLVLYIPAWSTSVMSAYGGLALFVLMTLESSSLPIPSEVVLPYAGFLVHDGRFSFATALALATVGAMIGSYIDYYVGRYLGNSRLRENPLFNKGLTSAENWFKRYGGIAVFATRFLAGARTLISFPAGASRMPFVKFSVLTLAGCLIWNAVLIYAGYILSEQWTVITLVMRQFYLPIAVITLIVLGYLLVTRYRSTPR